MPDAVDFSVIVCTYNRASNLTSCIAHLAGQEGVDDCAWEVLIVDNNSNDNTKAVVKALRERVGIVIRYAFEPQQGLSHARNLGIREASGAHVLFIDDDIHVTPGWLRAFAEAFRSKDCDAAGGPIIVRSPRPLPKWIRPEMMGFLGGLDYGETPCVLDGQDRYPFGGNMGFRRATLERFGGFDVGLGRKGSGERAEELFKGEEAAYFARVADGGASICYVPEGRVEHHILPYQWRRKFFLTLHYNEGFQAVQRSAPPSARKIGAVPLFVIRQLLRALGRFVSVTARGGPNASMRELMMVAYFWGRIRGEIDRKDQPGPLR
jgi:glycosyltransferase involved in cell wall biosynthesis